MAIHYQDKYILLDDDGLTIRRYYFPMGTEKRVLYKDIRKIDSHPMGPFTGQWRLWGGDHRHWLNWDLGRISKTRLLIIRTDAWYRPVITPDQPDEVARILEEKTGLKVEVHE